MKGLPGAQKDSWSLGMLTVVNRRSPGGMESQRKLTEVFPAAWKVDGIGQNLSQPHRKLTEAHIISHCHNEC